MVNLTANNLSMGQHIGEHTYCQGPRCTESQHSNQSSTCGNKMVNKPLVPTVTLTSGLGALATSPLWQHPHTLGISWWLDNSLVTSWPNSKFTPMVTSPKFVNQVINLAASYRGQSVDCFVLWLLSAIRKYLNHIEAIHSSKQFFICLSKRHKGFPI